MSSTDVTCLYIYSSEVSLFFNVVSMVSFQTVLPSLFLCKNAMSAFTHFQAAVIVTHNNKLLNGCVYLYIYNVSLNICPYLIPDGSFFSAYEFLPSSIKSFHFLPFQRSSKLPLQSMLTPLGAGGIFGHWFTEIYSAQRSSYFQFSVCLGK